MSAHTVVLTDEEIESIAAGLANSAWIQDHSTPSVDGRSSSIKDKRLCDRLESFLPPDRERAMWPDEIIKAAGQ